MHTRTHRNVGNGNVWVGQALVQNHLDLAQHLLDALAAVEDVVVDQPQAQRKQAASVGELSRKTDEDKAG